MTADRRLSAQIPAMARGLLIALTGLVAVSSIAGGLALAFGPALGSAGISMPPEVLERSPFRTALVPGLVLLVVVGGSHAVAMLMLVSRHRWQSAAAAVAGCGLLIWIFVQMIWIEYSPLQALYFGAGLVEVVLVLLLLGILSPPAGADRHAVRRGGSAKGRADSRTRGSRDAG